MNVVADVHGVSHHDIGGTALRAHFFVEITLRVVEVGFVMIGGRQCTDNVRDNFGRKLDPRPDWIIEAIECSHPRKKINIWLLAYKVQEVEQRITVAAPREQNGIRPRRNPSVRVATADHSDMKSLRIEAGHNLLARKVLGVGIVAVGPRLHEDADWSNAVFGWHH